MKSASAGLLVFMTVLVQMARCDEPPAAGRPVVGPAAPVGPAATVAPNADGTPEADGSPQATDTPPSSDGLKSQEVPAGKPRFRTVAIRGQVVWLAEALKSEFGISTVPEVAENVLAILTKDGQVFPIVEDLRGRAFRKDEQLRGRDTEILARRYEQQPMIQILRVYQIEDGQRYEVDYWCDVCAIIMFEKGPCACCQDDNRLRKQLVGNNDVDRSVLEEKTGNGTDEAPE